MSGLLRSARPAVVALLTLALVLGVNGFAGADPLGPPPAPARAPAHDHDGHDGAHDGGHDQPDSAPAQTPDESCPVAAAALHLAAAEVAALPALDPSPAGPELVAAEVAGRAAPGLEGARLRPGASLPPLARQLTRRFAQDPPQTSAASPSAAAESHSQRLEEPDGITRIISAALAAALALSAWPALASAHGLAGKRFFPSTLTIDDPFVSDELSLPTFLLLKEPSDGESPSSKVTSISGEFSKRIFPNLGLTLEGEWNNLNPAPNDRTESGFGNLEVSLKYQFFTSAAHETILSAAFGWEAGGTGRKKAGAESFDVFKPALLFGKGMGDLPDALSVAQAFRRHRHRRGRPADAAAATRPSRSTTTATSRSRSRRTPTSSTGASPSCTACRTSSRS